MQTWRRIRRGSAMPKERRFFRLTSQGQSIWATRNVVPLPLDYRRVLGLVNYSGYPEVIRAQLGRFPSKLVDEWLDQFQELRLIELAPIEEITLAELVKNIQ